MRSQRQQQPVPPMSPRCVGTSGQGYGYGNPPLSPQGAINLPPSIPISLDGEERTFAYSQHLLRSNLDTRPECFQAPPNRTITRRMSGDGDTLGGPYHSAHVSNQQPGWLASAVQVPSSPGAKQMRSHKGALPAIPYQNCDDVDNDDYVSSSLLSSWRSASSDRTVIRGDAQQQPQPRSSSADSVKRIVKRFFSKKLGGKVPVVSGSSSLNSDQSGRGKLPEIGACSAKGLKADPSGVGDQPWDLPPNYVDMIFTRDPVTNESRGDLV